MRYAFGPLIKRKQALTYIDDILLQAKDKRNFHNSQRISLIASKGKA